MKTKKGLETSKTAQKSNKLKTAQESNKLKTAQKSNKLKTAQEKLEQAISTALKRAIRREIVDNPENITLVSYTHLPNDRDMLVTFRHKDSLVTRKLQRLVSTYQNGVLYTLPPQMEF